MSLFWVVPTIPVAIALFAPLTLFAQPGTGRIKGAIGDEGGKPVSQITVLYHRIPGGVRDARGRFQPDPGQAPVSAQASADAAGLLATPQLPAGNYIFCVKAPGYLTSCTWSGWHRVTISGGTDHDFGKIVLKKSAAVIVRINDPQHLLPRDPNTSGLVVGVLDEGNDLHVPDQSTPDNGGRTIQIGVPFGRPMQIWIHSTRYHLTGGDNSPLSVSGTKIPFHATEGAASPSFTINIVGPM